MILNRYCAVQKSEAAKFFIATSFPLRSRFVLCMGTSAFLILDLTLHGQWHICQVRSQPPCSSRFAWLEHHPSLVNRTNKPVEVVKARCHNSSFKLCVLFGLFGPRSLQQMWLRKNYNFGRATSYHGQKWSQVEVNFDLAKKSTSWQRLWVSPRQALLFRLLIWHFMAHNVFEFHASHDAAAFWLVLGATLVLPIARVPLLKF